MQNEFHLATFAPPLVWARLVWANGGVAPRYWGRLARILAMTTLVTPLRAAEWLLYSRRVARTSIDHPPLFVLGFARSGTTHLQNLLAQDPSWGYVSTFQTVLPTFSLIARGRLKRLMEQGMEERTRPQDNVKITLDVPQEEDVAMANLSHRSYLHAPTFPRLGRRLFEKYALMGADPDGARLTGRELRRWERDYLYVLRKATIHAGGRRLMLRNVLNIGRVDHLVRLFPGAKFIHIVRSPYAVYPSMMHMYRKVLPLWQMDDYDWPEVEEFLIENYSRAMRKYMADRARIPAGDLAEVRFEDLDRNPLGELERLYAELGLPGWERAKGRVDAYLQTVSDYRKNQFRADPAVIDRVDERWRFAVDAWNYEPPPVDA